LIRASVRETLAIRGLLLVGDKSTTILTGGHVLRECRKCNQIVDLRLKSMPFMDVTFSASRRRSMKLEISIQELIRRKGAFEHVDTLFVAN
jgi:hypothetical protein